jgi:N-acetyl-anhydromuramyl-L-alanine amidase AmpD
MQIVAGCGWQAAWIARHGREKNQLISIKKMKNKKLWWYLNFLAPYCIVCALPCPHQPRLEINRMFIVKEGIVQNAIIKPQRFQNLEHGELKTVAGIVLHQTNQATAEATLLRYRVSNDQNGAHFLISPEGVIYQTARLDRICWHVGFLASRCQHENRCSPNYLTAIERLQRTQADKAANAPIIHQLEMAKPLSARYPSNNEALGIEVAGAPKNKKYQPATAAQNVASTWLVSKLLGLYGLGRDSVFTHGKVGLIKTPSEAQHVRF